MDIGTSAQQGTPGPVVCAFPRLIKYLTVLAAREATLGTRDASIFLEPNENALFT